MAEPLCVDPYGYIRHLEGRFSVAENARRLGHLRWLEVQMMELQGGWIATMPSEKVKNGLAVNTYEDAEHADLLGKRLPELRHPDPNDVRAPNAAFAALVERIGDASDMAERLVGMFRVLKPHLIVVYRQHLALTDHVVDMPTVRLLRRVIPDEERQLWWGLAALEEVANTAAGRRAAIAWQAELEADLVGAGGVLGDCYG
jgi:hypothetical protein